MRIKRLIWPFFLLPLNNYQKKVLWGYRKRWGAGKSVRWNGWADRRRASGGLSGGKWPGKRGGKGMEKVILSGKNET